VLFAQPAGFSKIHGFGSGFAWHGRLKAKDSHGYGDKFFGPHNHHPAATL
jgi:hypothetical protein